MNLQQTEQAIIERECKCRGCEKKRQKMIRRIEAQYENRTPEQREWLSAHLREAVAEMRARDGQLPENAVILDSAETRGE